eukprot:TRINITY_DN103913_c0_g1_i1.p2 TRINITY_DN103913_c0_g1~~TRINITY_DN103913_c0_g1_i1.p2  ORF type:complete len:177 (-),score=14.05 TRINITY_DN103913_c0_g1_i1:361-891(-)
MVWPVINGNAFSPVGSRVGTPNIGKRVSPAVPVPASASVSTLAPLLGGSGPFFPLPQQRLNGSHTIMYTHQPRNTTMATNQVNGHARQYSVFLQHGPEAHNGQNNISVSFQALLIASQQQVVASDKQLQMHMQSPQSQQSQESLELEPAVLLSPTALSCIVVVPLSGCEVAFSGVV